MSGPIFIVLAALLWAVDGLLRRSLYSLPPLTIVFMEHLIGLVILLPFVPKIWPEIKSLTLKNWTWAVWVAIFSSVFGTLWFTTALLAVGFVPFSVVFLLQKLQPVFVFLTGAILLGERPKPKRLLWSVLAIIAAYFVTFPMGQVNVVTGSGTIRAAGFALAAAFAWGTSTVFSRLLLQTQSNTTALAIRFFVATLFTGLLFVLLPGQEKISTITTSQLVTFTVIALSTGMVAMAFYYKGLAKTAPTVATILELIFPMAAVLIDAIVYKVVLHPTQYLAAIGLILAGIQVARLGKDGLPVRFKSRKVAGDGRGKTLGFPTINLKIPWNLVLTEGIYAGWIWINGIKYPGALHFGIVPTFNKPERSLEVFVLTQKPLSDSVVKTAEIEVAVVKKIREIKKFSGPKTLIAQMTLDVAETRQILKI